MTLSFADEKYNPLKVVNTLMNSEQNGTIALNERRCGESGTLAVTRPDVFDPGALPQGRRCAPA
jgi:hypothetical protein